MPKKLLITISDEAFERLQRKAEARHLKSTPWARVIVEAASLEHVSLVAGIEARAFGPSFEEILQGLRDPKAMPRQDQIDQGTIEAATLESIGLHADGTASPSLRDVQYRNEGGDLVDPDYKLPTKTSPDPKPQPSRPSPMKPETRSKPRTVTPRFKKGKGA